jgi:hypothetical protein
VNETETSVLPRWVVPVLVPILCGFFFLLSVLALGQALRPSLRQRPEYNLSFADVECPPPEGLARREFLAEVQYLTHSPDRLELLDPHLTVRLAGAFAAHPWVESIQHIEIRRGHRKPAIHVDLIYRQPVLAVCLPAGEPQGDDWAFLERRSGSPGRKVGPCRAVDRQGVLLPRKAVHANLPLLCGKVAAPTGQPGMRWGDPRVEKAAAAAAYLQPYQDRLRLQGCEVQVTEEGLVFSNAQVRIVWGQAPGREGPGEASAEVKLQRLLDYHVRHQGLQALEHDVRLLAHNGHFPLCVVRKP